jgi:type VI secretion system protein ImpK
MSEAARATDPSSFTTQGRLALALQEPFTVAVRLRADRQVSSDASTFRAHVKQLLASADRDARALGYDADTVRLAVYAYVAFLDESVLTASKPMFQSWSHQPLQEEIFGDHVAGENFFRYLADLLGRQDSEPLADLLEVYQLCLLLGFRGKYAANPDGLHGVVGMVQDKIRRVRGGVGPLSPAWAPPPGESAPAARDRWVRRLALAAGVVLVAALVFHLSFRFLLGGAVGDLRALAQAMTR